MSSTTSKLIGLAIIVVVITSVSMLSLAKQNSADAGSSLSKEDIEMIVADYIRNNPQTILDSVNAYQIQQEKERSSNAQKIVLERQKEIESDPESPVAGNPKGDITIVEFFDYSCGYCKHAYGDLMKILAEDKGIKIVFKEFPILGPNSLLAAQAALATHIIAPDKYFPLHQAMMQGRITGQDSINQIAGKLGIDTAKLTAKMQSEDVQKLIAANQALANEVGIRGTPAFIVNGQFVPGAVDYNGFKQMVEAARKGKK